MDEIKKVLYISDLDLKGSGYSHITINLCQGLAEKGYDVKVIALSYQNEQHPWDFSILPAQDFREVTATYNNLYYVWNPDITIVALDIPQQEFLLNQLQQFQKKWITITPLESDPLCFTWAASLMRADKVFFISEFGAKEAQKVGVPAEHLRVGIDTVSWKQRTKEEYRALRKKILGVDDDTFVVLTVADNQERKNLSSAMKIISKFKALHDDDFKMKYVLVTKPDQQVGWRLTDMATSLKIIRDYVEFERGLAFGQLWSLYACADAFLLTSKGEGLGMPVLEAMAVGVPVIATETGAIIEHIQNGDGWLVSPEYDTLDPYGNENRYFINIDEAVDKLYSVESGLDVERAVKKAREYVESRDWNIAVDQLDRAIEEILNEQKESEQTEVAGEIQL